MKRFNEWLETRDPEIYEESLKKLALSAAFLAGTTGAGAAYGTTAPYINNAAANAADTVGGVVGIKNGGDVTRAKEAQRAQIAKKVGGDAPFGGILGAGVGASILAGLRKKKNKWAI